ncbi:MAG: hypothetical protein ACJ72N_22055 [Labedaea sp.]
MSETRTDVIITTAGQVPPHIEVVPTDTPDAAPQPASTLEPSTVVAVPAPVLPDAPSSPATPTGVVPGAPDAPASSSSSSSSHKVGAVVTYAWTDDATGRDVIQTGLVVGHVADTEGDDGRPAGGGGYRVVFFDEGAISHPLSADLLDEVT